MTNTNAEWAVRKFGRVGMQFAVEVTVGPAGISAEWFPARPLDITDWQLSKYRAIRGAALREASARLGRAVLCVEV